MRAHGFPALRAMSYARTREEEAQKMVNFCDGGDGAFAAAAADAVDHARGTSTHHDLTDRNDVTDLLRAYSPARMLVASRTDLEQAEKTVAPPRRAYYVTPAIVVMDKAFHGRTIATLTATGSRKVQAGFEPLVQGFVRVPLNDLEAVRQVAEHNKNVVAIFVEPIQGEGGINVSRMEYLRGLKEICERKEWLFMSDEVQCGLGRTGKWFVYQHAGFLPDVVPLANR